MKHATPIVKQFNGDKKILLLLDIINETTGNKNRKFQVQNL